MGGGGYKAPSPPPQPTGAEAIREWVNLQPQVFAQQLEFAPKEAAQQVDIAQRYALPLGQAYAEAQKAMYPETSALQEQLATQAGEGMQAEMPTWARDQYLSDLRSNLGTNIGSPIAADYTSRGLMEQNKSWQDYYRNLGLSVAGRQPLAQPNAPGYSNYMAQFTPNAMMNFNQQGYSTAGNIYGNQLQAQSQADAARMNLIGSGIGAAGSMGGMAMLAHV